MALYYHNMREGDFSVMLEEITILEEEEEENSILDYSSNPYWLATYEVSVGLYLQEIGNIPLLKPDQERTLTQELAEIKNNLLSLSEKRAKAKDPASQKQLNEQLKVVNKAYQTKKNKIVEANLRLVVHIAKQLQNQTDSMTLSDLIQEGNLGLMKAIDKFKPQKGCRLSTYAFWWIRQSIRRAIANQKYLIRHPVHFESEKQELIAATSKLRQAKEEITSEKLAKEMDLNRPDTVKRILQGCQTQNLTSLNKVLPSDEDQITEQGDFIVNKDPWPDEETLANITREELKAAMNKWLRRKEKEVLELRFGITGNGESQTLGEVGKIFGITRERVRQIQNGALRKLRRHLDIKDFDFGPF